MRARIDKTGFPLIFASFGPLALFAPRGLWLPILLLLVLRRQTLASFMSHDIWPKFSRNAVFLILPIYTSLSALWAFVPENALITGTKLFCYFIAAMAVTIIVDRISIEERRAVIIWAAAGWLTVHLLVWVDLSTAGAVSNLWKQPPFTPNRYSQGAAISACVVLPLAVGLSRLEARGQAFVFAGVSAATIFLLQNEAAKLALVSGLVVYVIVRWRSIMFWPIILIALVSGILSPIFFAKPLSNSLSCSLFNIKPSAAHRVRIYEFSSHNVFKKPLLGWGMDGARSIPGGGVEVNIHDCIYKGRASKTWDLGAAMPLHPHNGSLQMWLELGAVGVTIFICLLGKLMLNLHRNYVLGDGRPLIAGLFTAIFLVYNISFGLWQSWLIFAMILLCALLRSLHVSGHETGGTPSR